MLVLSRKVGEQIIIADCIRVQVVAVCGNRVRLGFTAPDEVPILRAELCFEISGLDEQTPHAAPARA